MATNDEILKQLNSEISRLSKTLDDYSNLKAHISKLEENDNQVNQFENRLSDLEAIVASTIDQAEQNTLTEEYTAHFKSISEQVEELRKKTNKIADLEIVISQLSSGFSGLNRDLTALDNKYKFDTYENRLNKSINSIIESSDFKNLNIAIDMIKSDLELLRKRNNQNNYKLDQIDIKRLLELYQVSPKLDKEVKKRKRNTVIALIFMILIILENFYLYSANIFKWLSYYIN